MIHYENLWVYLSLGSKLRKIYLVLNFNQFQWLKPYVEFNTHKKQKIKAEKNSDKDRKALHKLMNNAVYGKAMENLRNRIDVNLVSNNNKKRQFKITSKPSYMPHKIFDNELVAIRKNRVTLTLNKPAYNGMCILGLSKGLYIKYVGGGAGGFL